MNFNLVKSFALGAIVALGISNLIGYQLTLFPVPGGQSSIRDKISEEYSRLRNIDVEMFIFTVQHARKIDQYIETPTVENKTKVLESTENLMNNLTEAGDLFGYQTIRWVNMFRIWNYNYQNKLFSKDAGQLKKLRPWDLHAYTYTSKISSSVSDELDNFQIKNFGEALSGFKLTVKPNEKTREKIEQIYNSEAKNLILKPKNLAFKGLTSCLSPSISDESALSVAAQIEQDQYYTRTCPFLVKNKSEAICSNLKNFPRPYNDDEAQERLNIAMAICGIAEARLESEAHAANEKYGELTYAEYYQKYLLPLIPKYKAQLASENFSSTENHLTRCDPNYLPVVNFRDPEVDAKTAAYVEYSYKYCQSYFEGKNDVYSNAQISRYYQDRSDKKT